MTLRGKLKLFKSKNYFSKLQTLLISHPKTHLFRVKHNFAGYFLSSCQNCDHNFCLLHERLHHTIVPSCFLALKNFQK